VTFVRDCALRAGQHAGGGRRGRLPGASLGLLLWLAMCSPLLAPDAHAEPLDEASVHAAYVINFVRYSRWPRLAPDAHLVVATLGPPESADALRVLASRADPVEGHVVKVRALSLNHAPPKHDEAVATIRAHAADAQLVYVAPSHRGWNQAVIEALAGRPVLTVGMGSEFVAGGGMFGLVRREGRVVFTANSQAIMRNPVDVSARVLMLARPLGPGVD
jgi:hypothetical protein